MTNAAPVVCEYFMQNDKLSQQGADPYMNVFILPKKYRSI